MLSACHGPQAAAGKQGPKQTQRSGPSRGAGRRLGWETSPLPEQTATVTPPRHRGEGHPVKKEPLE